MIIGLLILSVALILIILINRALKHNSKSCEFNLEINVKGFKINFKTKGRPIRPRLSILFFNQIIEFNSPKTKNVLGEA